MFRKCIEKVYNTIQWTKKWHFFHLLFISTGLVGLGSIAIVWGIELLPGSSEMSLDTHFENLICFPLGAIIIAFVCFSCVAFAIELLIIIFRSLARKKVYVLSPFLTQNTLYDKFYMLCIFVSIIVPPLLYIIALCICIIFFPEEI